MHHGNTLYRFLLVRFLWIIGLGSIVLQGALMADQPWPQWRGPSQNGVAPTGDYPIVWNESNDGEGIDWKLAVPGKGSSTPVVANSVAYLTSGVDGKNTLIAIDVADGKIRWQTPLGEDRGNKHKKGGGSNPSPVIHSDHVYAYFRSGDLACVDAGGEVRWQINLQDEFGEDTLWWDLGSSPLVTDSAVVVAVMQTGPSYLIALNPESGDVMWKQDRDLDAPKEAAQSYSTPLDVTIGGKAAIAVMGADHLTLHDAGSGKMIGKLGGFNPTNHEYFRSISSPVAEGNFIVCPYARGESVTTVRMDDLVAGKGDDAIAWFRDDLGSDVPTPVLVDGRVYLVSDGKTSKGQVTCLDVATGKTLWTVQLPKSRNSYSSSPLVAGNHLYVTAEDNTTHVIGPLNSTASPAVAPELVATNTLSDDEQFTVASLVPIEGTFLLRTKNSLYRLAK